MKVLKYLDFVNEGKTTRVYDIKWTKEKCTEVAKKYNSRIDFSKNDLNAYNASRRNGWLEEICSHMKTLKLKNYWTKEKCAEEALKYNTKSEFEKNSPSAYVKAGRFGWKDEICSHMKTNGNRYKRCIYAIEFPDNNVYIGLTHDYEKRFQQHLNDIKNNSIVLRHYNETGLQPIVKKITDYIDVDEASKVEGIKVGEYIKNGWNILNIAKCGNVGGKTIKWTKEKCSIEAQKYSSRIDFKRKSYNAYNACRRNNWLDDVCKHMTNKLKNWDRLSCEEESKKFKNRHDFKCKSSGAYGYAYNNNLLDELFPKNSKLTESKIKEMYIELPSYDDCVRLCLKENSPFYESKLNVLGYNISVFNYRLASYNDFISNKYAKEMRGICFVFNNDGALFNRYLLLEKFFNLNQVPESMYSIVKNYKIKYINNKEDGSIASFIKLPNGKVLGKSKMGFDNDQAIGINRVYKNNSDIKKLVDWALSLDYVPIFEYVSNTNRIVLRYPKEELILLRLRDNKTGKHIDLKNHMDKIGSVKIAPFEDDFEDLDHLMEVVAKQEDKEGVIVQAEDANGNDFFFKLKTPWYVALHGLLTDDIYKENIIIGYILDDKIDDILGQIPETEVEAHDRIEKIIKIIKDSINEKVQEINKLYDVYLEMGSNDKNFALKYRKDSNFGYVMIFARCNKLKKLSKEEILEIYDSYSDYEKAISRGDIYELAKDYIGKKTSKLEMARNWLEKKDSSLFFKDIEEQ